MTENDYTMHERLRKLELWRDGNGAVGAERRLQVLEEMTAKQDDAILIMNSKVDEILKILADNKSTGRWILENLPAWIPAIVTIGAVMFALSKFG